MTLVDVRTNQEAINEYRTIYRAAKDDGAKVTGLKGTMEEMEMTLIERINQKRGYVITREQILAEYE